LIFFFKKNYPEQNLSQSFVQRVSSKRFNVSSNHEKNNIDFNRNERLFQDASEYTFNNNYLDNNDINHINKNNEKINLETKYKYIENPFTPPETMKNEEKKEIKYIISNRNKYSTIGGKIDKKSDKIENIPNDL
jgi:hypothetical protein